jgi:hypothetical protein
MFEITGNAGLGFTKIKVILDFRIDYSETKMFWLCANDASHYNDMKHRCEEREVKHPVKSVKVEV